MKKSSASSEVHGAPVTSAEGERGRNGLKEIASALLAIQKAMPSIPRDSINPHFGSRFASLDGMLGVARPILNAHDCVLVQSTAPLPYREHGPNQVEIETTILHAPSGEFITGAASITFDKNDPQASGGAITYARRYSLATTLGLATEDDDDGNGASGRPAAAFKTSYDRGTGPVSAATAIEVMRKGASPVTPTSPKRVPFGDKKLFSELNDAQLQKALKWAQDKGKFKEFQLEAIVELGARTAAKAGGFSDMALSDDELEPDDDLPF